MPGKRHPLPRRFSAALSDKAYEALRSLNARYRYGNNYILTVLRENLDRIADDASMDEVFAEFAAGYDAPAGGTMPRK